MEQQHTPHRQKNGCKGPLLALLLGLAELGAFWYFRRSIAAMNWFIQYVSMPYKRVLSALVDPLPFSAGELVCTLGGLWLVWMAVRTLRQQRAGQRVLPRRLVSLAALAVWGYALVCGAWGVQYYGTGFAGRAGLIPQPVTARQRADTAALFARKVNETAPNVPRDASGRFAVKKRDILNNTRGLYEGVTQEYPFLAGPERRAKPAVYSLVMSAANFTGYIFPPLGESTLNVANFVGIAACVDSDKPEYVYSGYLFGYLHLANALYEADRDLWSQTGQLLCSQAIADFEDNNAYWAKFDGLTAKVMTTTYEGFLQSYGQDLGMKSYGACVDLLVARYCPQ